MKGMTATQIQSRLAEIDSEQAAFDSRDFDAELSQVIVNGGNVDALEEQHLQAERLARRLRVERQALESTLPEVALSEATSNVRQLVEKHNGMISKHHALAEGITKTLVALEKQADEMGQLFAEMQNLAFAASSESARAEKRTGQPVAIPPLAIRTYEPLKDLMPFVADLPTRLRVANGGKYPNRGYADGLTYQSSDDA